MASVSRGLRNVKEEAKLMLGMKNRLTDMKKAFGGLVCRLDMVEGKNQ